MSFNINMKQPQKPKIGLKNEPTLSNKVGFDGNALSQQPKEVTDVQFGNSARDNLLQKQIEAIRNDVNAKVLNVENQVDLISIKCDNTVTKVDSLGRQVSSLDTKVNDEKTARENADTQLQKSIDEIDEKIEHLDKYAEKTTTVGGVSLQESTEYLNKYKYQIPAGFISNIDWTVFDDVNVTNLQELNSLGELMVVIYGTQQEQDFPKIALMALPVSEKSVAKVIMYYNGETNIYVITNISAEGLVANIWYHIVETEDNPSITIEVPSSFEVNEELVQNEEYFSAIYNRQPSLINLDEKFDNIENQVSQSGSIINKLMEQITQQLDNVNNDIEQLQDNLSNEEGTRQAQDEILQQNIDNVDGRVDDVYDTLDTPLKTWVYDKQEGMTMQPVFNPIAEPQIIGTMIGTAQAICGESSATKTIYKDIDNNITINISYSSGSTRRLYITYLVDGYEYKNNITGTLDMSTYQYTYYSSWQQISPTVKPISSQDDLPILSYSDDYIYDSNVEAVKAFLKYEANVHDNKTLMSDVIDSINQDILDEASARQQADTTLQGNIDDEKGARQNADTALGGRIDNEATTRDTNDNSLAGAISDRVCLVKMDNVVLNNWTDVGIPQEFENYSYVAVVRDTNIIGAQSVNVLFTIEQILSDNYCPAPLVDNVEGIIKIFGNDNMTITIPSIEIFKPIIFTLNNGGE